MPVVKSLYRAPLYFFNGHIQTIIPALFREVPEVLYQRERINTPDGDFLDLDWSKSKIPTKKLVILSHGLEGDASRPYIKGMVKAMNAAGFDTLAWNFRSCSGEPNKLLRSYHMGATDDLDLVVQYSLQPGYYQELYLVGFSMGGNITLNYLGQKPEQVPEQVKKAVVFSVPCHINSASRKMAQLENRVYMQRFLKSLRKKLTDKVSLMPATMTLDGFHQLRTFPEFDNRYTAPIHGFKDAHDYYSKCSSRQYLPNIRIPTLLVNAQNDPFLSPECFPVAEAEANPVFFLEMPVDGGHVGFVENYYRNLYYSERRAVAFFTQDYKNESH
ncbi:alpha/beta hydrolase [Adhaeribacter arboris]|uniref:Alpha/beta hydrolase n=1 Tax=Adhaeribacter arboris TaxID=2072846 RepID=A0A2T2YFL7_9BACT|nr:alpha/beta fold hydrolase [Adhaeribacter arboris]PSR54316.1 alpha/beta hydrolase [Adhaeribacter arboris]